MAEHGAHCSVRNTWLQARASMTALRPLDHLKILDMESAGFQRHTVAGASHSRALASSNHTPTM